MGVTTLPDNVTVGLICQEASGKGQGSMHYHDLQFLLAEASPLIFTVGHQLWHGANPQPVETMGGVSTVGSRGDGARIGSLRIRRQFSRDATRMLQQIGIKTPHVVFEHTNEKHPYMRKLLRQTPVCSLKNGRKYLPNLCYSSAQMLPVTMEATHIVA